MPDPTRRTVVCGLLAGLVAPVSLAACSSETPSGSATAPTTGGSGAGGGTPLAKLADLPVGGGKIVDGPSGKVLLVRPSEQEVRGLDPVCPHAGVTVSPPAGGTITCTGHGSVFDGASGDVKKGPATSGLTPVPVKIDGDSVVTA